MEIQLKETLRMLRRKKNVTQETLADYLGITPQSVGKWERGEGYPDITMLPKIALYFGVTVDELLDVGKARIDEAIEAYRTKSMEYCYAGESEKDVALWEEAYREFPNDCRVISGLMGALGRTGIWPSPEAERIISLGERILQESNDTQLRERALQELCYAYKGLGNQEKAMYYADRGGSFYGTREALTAFVQEGEEGVKACQSYIMSLLNEAASVAVFELPEKGGYTAEEEIGLCEFAVSLMQLLFSDGNAGFYAGYISHYYFYLAFYHAAAGNGEKALEALENMKNYAVMDAAGNAGDYTALPVNRLKYDLSKTAKNYRGNACDLRLQDLKRKEFDFLREEERFAKMEKELKRKAQTAKAS